MCVICWVLLAAMLLLGAGGAIWYRYLCCELEHVRNTDVHFVD